MMDKWFKKTRMTRPPPSVRLSAHKKIVVLFVVWSGWFCRSVVIHVFSSSW
jgi:hypothetical protein